MQIDKNWPNVQKRAFDPDQLPERVFIEHQHNLNGSSAGYEYSAVPPPSVHWTIDDLLSGPYARQNFITLFYTLPEIFAPVNEIASRVSDAVWNLKSTFTDQIDYKNKDFNRLFERPNPLMSHKEFVWQSVCYDILCGANLQFINQPDFMPDDISSILGWFNLPTPSIKIEPKKGVDVYSSTELNDLIQGYSQYQNGRNRMFDVKNVIPFMNLDLREGNDFTKFKSILCGAKIAIANLIPVYEARGVIYIKRGALGFLVSRKSDESGMISLTPGEKKEAQDVYQDTYGLNRGKNLVGVTAAPLDYISTSMSIQELQPFDETLADATVIYATLRVPKHFVPSKDNSTFNNAGTDTVSFYNDVIIPYAKKYAQGWNGRFKIPNRYIEPSFSHISALQEDQVKKANADKSNGATYLQRWQNGAISLNEWIMAINGEKGVGPIYDKKLFDLTPEELETVKNVLLLLKNGNNNITTDEQIAPGNTGN